MRGPAAAPLTLPLFRAETSRQPCGIVSLALEARDVVHRYRGTLALDGVSIDVPAGTMLALVGESGSGKTTLLRTFNRLVDPDGGTVRLGGASVREANPVALRRGVGYVPQHGGLLPHWSVLRNVALVPRLVGHPDPEAAARDALARLGLDAARFGARLPRELSGGQRQRAAIARALAARQEVVLLDEPFGALDAISRAEAHEAFDRVRRETGFTALLVTHDLTEAARLADRVAVMRAGRVEQTGGIGDLRRAPTTDYVRSLFARAEAASTALESG
jgi:osmoprotectant transport system ATP-binding protein